MKKGKKFIIIIGIILIGIMGVIRFSPVYDLILLSNALLNETRVQDFDSYKDDYQIVVDSLIENRNLIEKNLDHSCIGVRSDQETFYNTETFKDVKIKGFPKKSLKKICGSFDYGYSIDRIVFTENTITFATLKEKFGIAYSINGKKPTGLGYSWDKDFKYHIKHLQGNWYSVKEVGYIGE